MPRPNRLSAAGRILILPGLLVAGPTLAAPVLPDFAAATFLPHAAINNPYLPLVPGTKAVFIANGVDEDGQPFQERAVLQPKAFGPTLLGVKVQTTIDRAYEDDVLVEKTRDYFAQDTDGNVWYMGEDVINYNYDDDGNLIDTDSGGSWRAGVNDALPGFAMPGAPTEGFSYYQEFAAADDALDVGTVLGLLDSLLVSGTLYKNVLQIFETTPLEPDAREIKYYAPGVGLIREEEGVDANYENPELTANRVSVAPVPLPATLPLAAVGLATLFGLGRRRDRATPTAF